MTEKKMMTKAGHKLLSDEYQQLFSVERPQVVQGVANAAAEGDRSENAEYIYGKKKLREIDKRLQYLANLLKDVEVIDEDTLRGNKVMFASTAIVEDAAGQLKSFTLVGEGESDAGAGRISYRSPVGRALLGRSVGDIVQIEVPSGEVEYEIVGVKYAGRLAVGRDS